MISTAAIDRYRHATGPSPTPNLGWNVYGTGIEAVANAKSVMSFLALGDKTGDVVSVVAAGPDAEAVIQDIVEIMVSTEAGP